MAKNVTFNKSFLTTTTAAAIDLYSDDALTEEIDLTFIGNGFMVSVQAEDPKRKNLTEEPNQSSFGLDP